MSCITQHMHSVLPEKIEDRRYNEEEENKDTKETKPYITKWVLCSEDWRDIVIMYVPELNDIPIEDNYADISQEGIKKAYKQYKRRTQVKRANDCICEVPSIILYQNFCCDVPYIYTYLWIEVIH